MATAAPPIPAPALIPTADPSHPLQNLGQSAAARVALREERLTELEIRGDIKPATIVNRSPFELKVETGLWSYTVPPRPAGKPFSAHTITGCIWVPFYKGNQEMSDKSLQPRFDGKILLPFHQALEFKHWYVGQGDEDRLLKQGGVIVFEGTMEGINANSTVRVPEFIYRKGKRYPKFTERLFKELVLEADNQMFHHFGVVLEEAGHMADDPQMAKNIQRYHHTVADFMLAQQKIEAPPKWRNSPIQAGATCKRCNQQYVSKTGICKCGNVQEPFVAYMNSEIEIDHVRMKSLTKEEWAKVNIEEARRKDARGETA